MEESKSKVIVINILYFFISVSIVLTFAFLYGKSMTDMVYVTVLYGLGALGIQFMGRLVTWLRMWIMILVCLLCCLLPMIPENGWPMIILFLGASLFWGNMYGITLSCVYLFVACLLCKTPSVPMFFMYFIAGIITVILFQDLDDNLQVGTPVFLSLLAELVCLTAGSVLVLNEKFNPAQFVVVLINLFVSFIIMLLVIKMYSGRLMHKYRDVYLEINDPEHELMSQLKEQNKEEYYKAIHTAYFSYRIASSLGMDDTLSKCLAYYHNIGILKGASSKENTLLVASENNFPPDIMQLLEEYAQRSQGLHSKEAVVVYLSEAIVSSVMYLFSKNPKIQIDYEQVLGAVLQKKMDSYVVNNSDITLHELMVMRKIFVEEKLYYDFLR